MAQQFLVNDPFAPFTVNNQFKAIANGKVYVGIECGDPLNVSQQIQVYHKNGCGDYVPVSQPISTNAGGFLSYNGGASQFVVKQPFSIVVKNANNVEEWRVDKVFNLSGDDWNGFSNALLAEAGITPSGIPDTAIASQRLDALKSLIPRVGDAIYNRTFNNVDAMKLSSVSVGLTVITRGYYAAGDKGGAVYVIQPIPAVADGLIDHALTNGAVAKLLHSGPIDIKTAGAKGNGTGDSSPSIAAVISRNVGTYVSAGDYRISYGFELPYNQFMTAPIYGDGHASQIRPSAGFSSDSIFKFVSANNGGNSLRGFELKNLLFDGFYAFDGGEDWSIFSTDAALRGLNIEGVLGYKIRKGFSIKDSYAQFSIQNTQLYLYQGAAFDRVGTYGLFFDGNAIDISSFEVVGGYELGINIENSNVVNLDGYDVAGSDSSVQNRMTEGVRLTNCKNVSLKSGYMERFIDQSNAEPALTLTNVALVDIQNTNVAQGSIYLNNVQGTIDNTFLGNNASRIQTDSDCDVTIGLLQTYDSATLKPEFSGYYPQKLHSGKVNHLKDYNLTDDHSEYLYFDSPKILSTDSPIDKAIAGFRGGATATTETDTSGSYFEVTGGKFSGLQFIFSGLEANKIYTIQATVKSAGDFDTYWLQNAANPLGLTSRIPNIGRARNKDQLIYMPVTTDSSGGLKIDMAHDFDGTNSFIVRDVQLARGWKQKLKSKESDSYGAIVHQVPRVLPVANIADYGISVTGGPVSLSNNASGELVVTTSIANQGINIDCFNVSGSKAVAVATILTSTGSCKFVMIAPSKGHRFPRYSDVNSRICYASGIKLADSVQYRLTLDGVSGSFTIKGIAIYNSL